MSYYGERNGLAKEWDRDHAKLLLSRWVFHYPDKMLMLIEKLREYNIDLIDDLTNYQDDFVYNISLFANQLNNLTEEDFNYIADLTE